MRTVRKTMGKDNATLRQRIRWDRPLLSYSAVQSVVGGPLRNRWRGKRSSHDYLNVGCGPRTSPGFVHLDCGWHPGIDVCWDLRNPHPFAGASVKGIFAEHFMEHLSYESCAHTLRELRRVLRPNGTLRIVVPDAELYLRACVDLWDHNQDNSPRVQPIEGQWTAIRESNQVFRGHGYLFAYDFETVSLLVRQAGFRECVRTAFLEGRDPKLLIDSPERRPESLYVEAIR